ncbi:IclR family transcriptional regulator [Bacillaceae bacterium]
MAKEYGSLSSVRNAIRILREFSQDEPELGITELSLRLDISKSSVHRLLKTLSEENLVKKNKKTRKYHLWLAAFEIGSVVYNGLEVCQTALPLLKKMTQTVPGVIQLVIYDHGEIVYLLKLPEDKETRIFNSMGKRVSAHCTASGKVLLAHQSEKEIARVLRGGLKACTCKTITSAEQLKRELKKIREQGFGTSREEFKLGICSLAVPVFNDRKQVVAAISATGPCPLFSPMKIPFYLKEMKTYSRLITEQLEMIEREF